HDGAASAAPRATLSPQIDDPSPAMRLALSGNGLVRNGSNDGLAFDFTHHSPPPILGIGISISIYITTKWGKKIPPLGIIRRLNLPAPAEPSVRPPGSAARRHVAPLTAPPYRAEPP